MVEITKEEAVALSAIIYFPDMEIMSHQDNITMEDYLKKLSPGTKNT